MGEVDIIFVDSALWVPCHVGGPCEEGGGRGCSFCAPCTSVPLEGILWREHECWSEEKGGRRDGRRRESREDGGGTSAAVGRLHSVFREEDVDVCAFARLMGTQVGHVILMWEAPGGIP